MHFDMDSPYRSQNGEWLFPLLTCVVFLSDAVGGPTLILNQTRSGPLAERGWLVRPDRAGTVYCFDAKLLHGVLPAFTTGQQTTPDGGRNRLSINIVLWERECAHVDEFDMTCFERELPVHRGRGYETELPWEADMRPQPSLLPVPPEDVSAYALQEVAPVWDTASE